MCQLDDLILKTRENCSMYFYNDISNIIEDYLNWFKLWCEKCGKYDDGESDNIIKACTGCNKFYCIEKWNKNDTRLCMETFITDGIFQDYYCENCLIRMNEKVNF